MGRLLDEDDVIDAVSRGCQEFRGIFARCEKNLNELPPAQQEPKSPLYYGDGYSEGKMVYDSAECPNCGYIYDEGDHVWGEPYCPHCGQALDWYMRGEQDG